MKDIVKFWAEDYIMYNRNHFNSSQTKEEVSTILKDKVGSTTLSKEDILILDSLDFTLYIKYLEGLDSKESRL
jgi:archaellum biogenesis ATPase FlaH